MPQPPSITLSESFQSRLQRAERTRLMLVLAAVGVLLATWVARQALGGVVASNAVVYHWVIGILLGSMAVQAVLLAHTQHLMRQGRHLPTWHHVVGAVVDLATPFGVLLVLHIHSPRGPAAELAAPALLLVPMVILLSVLRLKPMVCMLIGLAAGLAHLGLAASAFLQDAADRAALPLMASYSVLLAAIGAAAAFLAGYLRGCIRDAVREAETAERSTRALAVVSKELQIARDIQQSLLPTAQPDLPGLQFAGMSRPAAEAGGDYYDWQPLPDGRLAVAIADVTGHGIGPALVMAVCRAYARATAPNAPSPPEFLARLNELILGDLSGARFITMAVAVVGPDGDVDLISAGHGPTFLYRARDGSLEEFGGTGLPLGVAEGEDYNPVSHLRLESGDALILLTDGFMEHPGPNGSLFGIQRLAAVIREHATAPATKIIAALDAAVAAFAGGTTQSDDMTAVVIKRA